MSIKLTLERLDNGWVILTNESHLMYESNRTALSVVRSWMDDPDGFPPEIGKGDTDAAE